MKNMWIVAGIVAGLIFAGTAGAADKAAKKRVDLLQSAKVLVYETAKDNSNRLGRITDASFEDYGQPMESQSCIFIDPTKTFQTFVGVGGALTDASAEVFATLSKEKQQEFLTAYFSVDKGIGYSLARTNMQSCDFSSDIYSYVETDDKDLKTFSIAHDLKYRLPFIRQAYEASGRKLSIYVSPWSPPAWMKTNNDPLHGGKLKPECYQSWANFFVKYIKAYEKENIPIWGLTVQNEPMATQTWESCVYTAEEERDFVKNYLGPTLKKSGLKSRKLMIWDHNRDLVYQRASTVLNDRAAAKYVWGTAFHWYVHDDFDNIKRVQEAFPTKNLLFTEGCAERFDQKRIDEWGWGEKYAISMVHDFNNGAVGWTDWNVLLDERGGPNHVGNFCYAPVHTTASGGLYFMNSFYYIGHFSKFIRPGAKRIISSSTRDDLLTTAFINPDGTVAVVVLNTSDTAIPYKLWLDGKAATLTSLAHSIMTMVLGSK
jgi:glucosylceramidase